MPNRPVRRPVTYDDILDRIRREFRALPGLHLTGDQACRLWSLSPTECHALLSRLVDTHFLARTNDGGFVRADMRAHVVVPRSPALPSFRRSA